MTFVPNSSCLEVMKSTFCIFPIYYKNLFFNKNEIVSKNLYILELSKYRSTNSSNVKCRQSHNSKATSILIINESCEKRRYVKIAQSENAACVFWELVKWPNFWRSFQGMKPTPHKTINNHGFPSQIFVFGKK